MGTEYSDMLIDDHSPLSRTLVDSDYIPAWGRNGLKRDWKALTAEEIRLIRDASKPAEND